MSIKAKILAEIESKIGEYDKWIDAHPIQSCDSPIRARRKELMSLKDDFINSLPDEECDGLEEEIKRYLEPIHTSDIQFEPFTQMTRCARHFAEWGAKHLKK